LKKPDSIINVSGTADRINAFAAKGALDFTMEFTPGVGRVFQPGTYRDAERVPFETGRSPGLSVTSGSSGCNQVYGSITVDQISLDADGNLEMLDLSFVQHCESADTPPLRGTILFKQLPLNFELSSFSGAHLVPDRREVWLNRDSTIQAGGDPTEIGVHISGHRVQWHLTLRAPTGQVLEPGTTYETTQHGDATHAGLSVTGPDHCAESTGTLTIKELVAGGGDSIEHLRLRFSYHCTGYVRYLEGTLRLLA
jgi:hypothetical protein